MTDGLGAVRLLAALVKIPLPPAGDAVVDVVLDVLDGVDDLVNGAADGWSAADEDVLAVNVANALADIPGVSVSRAQDMARGIAAAVSLIVEAALQKPRKPKPPRRKLFRKLTRA